MKKSFKPLLSFLLAFAWFPAFSGDDGRVNAAEARAVSDALSETFRNLGGFQAEYRAVRPGQVTTLTIAHNPAKRFVLLTVRRGFPELSTLVQLMEYGAEDDAFGEVRLTYGEPPRLARMHVDVEKKTRDMTTPIGVMLFLAEQFRIASGLADGLPRLPKPSPFFEFEIRDRGFHHSLGVVAESERLGASWLSPESIQQVERVTQTPETVTLHFPGGRQVEMQRATGLLAKEHWPDKRGDFPESITLVAHKPLEDHTGFEELQPALATAEIREAPKTQLRSALYVSMFTQLNRMFAELEGFETQMEALHDEISGQVKNQGRVLVRADARRILSDSPERDRIARFFEQAYEDFAASEPDLAREHGLAGFLQGYFNLVKQNPAENLIPPLKQISGQIEETYHRVRANLPGWENTPVGKLHNHFLPALLDAWRLELTAATLEHTETILDGE